VLPLNNAHALVVGIANYQHVNRLPLTVLNDARDIYALLIDPQHCGYLNENVQLLLDEQATQSGLRQALAELAKRSTADSTVLIYISSHGGRTEAAESSREYLLPMDADLATNQTLEQTAISGDEFTTALRSIQARKVLVILDCCHAAGIGQPKDVHAPVLKTGLPERYYEALQIGHGRAILASSRSTEYSWVLPGAVNSLFTQYLLAGLRGGISSEDGLIRIFDLFEYLQPRVTGDRPQQHPVFKAELEENFPVAFYLGGQKKNVRTVDQGFRYDAYISYANRGLDAAWVWETLVPRLEQAGLRIAVSDDVEEPGVARVVNVERGIQQSKRTVIILSEGYLKDNLADFENVLAQTIGLQEGTYRLLPLKIAPLDDRNLPVRLGALTTLDMSRPQRVEREFERLVQALRGPLPRR
jgi:hypothetical protein